MALRRVKTQKGLTYNPTVAGDRVTVPHLLRDFTGAIVTPTYVHATARQAAADGALTANVMGVVSFDSANVVLRGSAAPVTYDLIAVYEGDFEKFPS